MHVLLISENEFTHEIKRDGITRFHGIHVKDLSIQVLTTNVPGSPDSTEQYPCQSD